MTNAENKLKKAGAFVFKNFGPLVVFYGLNSIWGLKAAIAGTLVATIVEIVLAFRKKEPLSGFFIFCVIMTVGFGIVDLVLADSFLFRYEAAITNLITCVYFGSTAFGSRPLLAELARKSGKFNRQVDPDLIFYFKIFTWIWTIYFFLKAWVYYDQAKATTNVNELLLKRFLIGNGSFVLMFVISVFAGRYLLVFLRHMKWLPSQRKK